MSNTFRFRIVLYVFSIAFLTWAAALTTAKAQDSAVFEKIISKQIEAFRTGDAQTAFSLASRSIQLIFREPENFIFMVKRQYHPVYSAKWYKFDKFKMHEGVPTQSLILLGAGGGYWLALYQFEKQTEGLWKIRSVILRKLVGGAA
jgi:hypothetical protein